MPDNTRPTTGDIDILSPGRRLWPHYETLTLETTLNLLRSGVWHTLPCCFTILWLSTEVQWMVTEWHNLNWKSVQHALLLLWAFWGHTAYFLLQSFRVTGSMLSTCLNDSTCQEIRTKLRSKAWVWMHMFVNFWYILGHI